MVTAITTVYNEEAVIGRKLDNLLALEYPKDCLQILIVSDGSEDGTNDVVRSYAERGVELHVRPERGGVTAAFNDAVALARGGDHPPLGCRYTARVGLSAEADATLLGSDGRGC
jgi:glycosyltransferase involved in cell wall biosynthesis